MVRRTDSDDARSYAGAEWSERNWVCGPPVAEELDLRAYQRSRPLWSGSPSSHVLQVRSAAPHVLALIRLPPAISTLLERNPCSSASARTSDRRIHALAPLPSSSGIFLFCSFTSIPLPSPPNQRVELTELLRFIPRAGAGGNGCGDVCGGCKGREQSEWELAEAKWRKHKR